MHQKSLVEAAWTYAQHEISFQRDTQQRRQENGPAGLTETGFQRYFEQFASNRSVRGLVEAACWDAFIKSPTEHPERWKAYVLHQNGKQNEGLCFAILQSWSFLPLSGIWLHEVHSSSRKTKFTAWCWNDNLCSVLQTHLLFFLSFHFGRLGQCSTSQLSDAYKCPQFLLGQSQPKKWSAKTSAALECPAGNYRACVFSSIVNLHNLGKTSRWICWWCVYSWKAQI